MPTFKLHPFYISAIALPVLLTACGGGGGGSSGNDSQSGPSGADPVSATSTTAASPSRKGAPVTMHWPVPQLREDGSVLAIDEIAGYELTYKNSRRELQVVTIDDPLVTSYLIEYLPADNYEFAVFAFDKQNTLSQSSPLARLSLDDFPLE